MRPGDLVGVCAPAGPVDAERFERGLSVLEGLGFRVRVGSGTRGRHLFFAGTGEERLRDLAGLLEDDDVAAVFCARGGAGCGWLLPALERLPMAIKPIVGYSDVTFLHLWRAHQRMTSVYGPMVTWELGDDRFHRESLLWALTGEGAPTVAAGGEEIWGVREGEAEGRLVGGCLSILAAATGTPWALRTEGEEVILFVEDVDEPPFRIDRMLMQLRLSGALAGVRGVVLGDMKGCAAPHDAGYSLEDAVLHALDGLDVPVAMGLSSGHTASPMVSLPLGARARLSCAAEARLEMLEPAVGL